MAGKAGDGRWDAFGKPLDVERMNENDEMVLREANLLRTFCLNNLPLSNDDIHDRFYQDKNRDAFIRAFDRDRARLKKMGILLKKTEVPDQTSWSLDRASLAPDNGLDASDALLIEALCSPVVHDPSSPYQRELVYALGKLNANYSLSVVWREVPGDTPNPALSQLLGALRDRHPVDVDYTNGQGVKTTRCLAPYGHFSLRGHLYFVAAAYDKKTGAVSDEPRTYRLDRFGKVAVCDRRSYEVPEGFSAESFKRLPFQIGTPRSEDAVFLVPDSLLAQKEMATSDTALRAIRSGRGTLSDDGRWSVWAADFQAAAIWAIDAGLVPLAPGELVSSYTQALRGAAGTTVSEMPHAAPARPPRRRVGRKSGEAETRQLMALLGAIRPNTTLTADVISERLGCSPNQARHLLAILIQVSDDGESGSIPLVMNDDAYDSLAVVFSPGGSMSVRLTPLEGLALVDALRRAGLDTDDPLFRKLAPYLGETPVHPTPPDVEWFSNKRTRANLPICARALAADEALGFTYTAGISGKTTRRLARPLKLTKEGEYCLLVAFDLSRQAVREFRLDRMRDVAPAPANSRPPDLPPSADEVRELHFVLTDTRLFDVLDWQRAKTEPLDGGWARVDCPDFGGMWIVRRLAACGSALVTDDGGLLGRVHDYARKLLERCGGTTDATASTSPGSA